MKIALHPLKTLFCTIFHNILIFLFMTQLGPKPSSKLVKTHFKPYGVHVGHALSFKNPL